MITISDPCEHDFTCTEKAKWTDCSRPYNIGYFRRLTFHCRKCLKEEVKIRSEWTREAPDWWKGKE